MDLSDQPDLAESARLRHVTVCLLKYLEAYSKAGRDFDVLAFLAQETIQHLDEGKNPRFNNIAIQHAVAGSNKGEASSWLSPIWKKLVTQTLPSREEGLQAFAREHGFTEYPWVCKLESPGGAGNQTLYFIEARQLPVARTERAPTIDRAKSDITYIPVEYFEPSWWARWFFGKDRSADGWRKAIVVWLPFVSFITYAIFGVLGLYVLGQGTKPVSAQDLVSFALIALVAWFALRAMNWCSRLVDDRIVMAPESMVGFKEFGVCLELAKPANAPKEVRHSLRLIKYAAECPICGAEVLLDRGEPDFPRRIVGRCQESPREHVFSFDRATRNGSRLR
ncbi:MAG TPA: hypothetical protein PLB04_18630 [Nitrospira sp.]|nr:hypothetical protein [Nitrospira sp.]